MKVQATRLFLFLPLLCLPLRQSHAQTILPQHYWIFFRDKGSLDPATVSPQSIGISDRALKRRAKVMPREHLIDERDLPVAKEYVDQLRDRGFTIRTISRWLNAVSVVGSVEQIERLATLPFVRMSDIVQSIPRPHPEVSSVLPEPFFFKSERVVGLDYGASITQLQSIKVPDVHSLGIFGSGVLVGMIDDGFNNHRSHNALRNISVLAEYDWIQADSNTSRSAADPPGQGDHGCYTLSALAGFDNGHLIGPAFESTLILAKTEFDPTETQIELDNYVAALEWMERLGADVVSTSLGYDDLDPMGKYNAGDITYDMKDGRSAVTSRAGSIAAGKGVLLVTAMGNEGWQRSRYRPQDSVYVTVPDSTGSLITPADADSIVSVGAAFSSFFGNELAPFSSTGPTADGRFKPEVVAQGVSVVSANPNNPAGYVSVSGTSLSTPLVAGVAALIFSAHPELTPMQVRQALITTAIPINDPDPQKAITGWPNNYYGYGLVNALDAVLYHGLAFSNRPTVTASNSTLVVSTMIAAKSGVIADSVSLYFRHVSSPLFERVAMTPGSQPDQFEAVISRTAAEGVMVGYFSARENSGVTRLSPFNAPDSLFVLSFTPPSHFALHNNYPNPFNGSTTISFDAPTNESVELAVFNILGQRIKTIFSGNASTGRNVKTWDGTDEAGRVVASGAYIYRLKTPTVILSGKLLYLR